MKALVTGSTGFIGSQLVEKLLARDYKVSCLIRKSTKLEYVNDLPVEFVKADYGNPASSDFVTPSTFRSLSSRMSRASCLEPIRNGGA